VKMRISIFL